jgi:hypothetical protein
MHRLAAPLHLSPSSPALLFGGTTLGTYDVSLDRPSYAPWNRSGVTVMRTGPCGDVLPTQLTALLQPTQ